MVIHVKTCLNKIAPSTQVFVSLRKIQKLMNVSVIIPCRNEERYIAECIDSVITCNYPQDNLEIIVVDGQSSDATRDIVQKIREQFANIYLMDNPQQTTQWALNMGIKNASGDVIFILGAHAMMTGNYIGACVEILERHPEVGCAGGVTENIYADGLSGIIGRAMSGRFGVGNAHFRTGTKSGYVDTVAFGAYRKQVFDRIGFFDEELVRNQDDEFSYRMIKNGFKIYLDPALKLLYHARASFKSLFRQYFQYGYWKVYVNKKHKAITTLRQLVPALFVLFLFPGFLITFAGIYLRFFYRLTLLMYLLLAIRSGLYKVDKVKELMQYVWACFILHISYGSGYLYGILHFVMLRKKPSDFSKKLTR